MTDVIQLQPSEIVAGRPFTNVQKSFADAEMMQFMVEKLRTVLSVPSQFESETVPLKINFHDEDGHHRIILVDWHALQLANDITAVGFFGQARSNMDHTPINDLENQLIDQLVNFPGLFGYYNLHFPNGQWGNLVMCRDDNVKDQWRDDSMHQQAVEFTPRHYHSLRLHNGLIPGGVMGQKKFILTRTKYFDYDAVEIWRAVRYYGMAIK